MPQVDPQIRKRQRYKKLLCWLLIDLAVAVTIFALLLYKPSRYDPLEGDASDHRPGQVSPYLTRLSSEYYNGAQRRSPFELVVTEEGINQAITGSDWAVESEGIWLYAPAVLFAPGSIVLMGTANLRGAEFVVSIELEPKIDEQKLLNLQVAKVKIGAMNIAPVAKLIAKKMYADRLAAMPVDTEDWRSRIAGALLNDEPFDPVFPAEDKNVRLDSVTVEQGRLILRLVPISQRSRGASSKASSSGQPVQQ
jgi:hypothetical protein